MLTLLILQAHVDKSINKVGYLKTAISILTRFRAMLILLV